MTQCETCIHARRYVSGLICAHPNHTAKDLYPSTNNVNPYDECSFWSRSGVVESDTDNANVMVKFDKNKRCIKCGSSDANYVYKKTRGIIDYVSPKEEHIVCHCKCCHYEWYMKPLQGD